MSLHGFKLALQNKEPFVVKKNGSTLNVELFDTEKRGQAVGLNYFSSIANTIETKFNDRYEGEITKDSKSALVLYKNDILKVDNMKKNEINYYLFNGGGDVSGTNNQLTVKNINIKKFLKVDKKGNIKKIETDNISPGKTIIISKVHIDFFGNISEV